MGSFANFLGKFRKVLSTEGGTMGENAIVNLFNGSKWQQSTPDKGIAGTAGFSIICSAGYEYKFALGYLFVLSDNSTTVRKVLYAPVAPTATDDTTLGFTTDTTWEMADGTLYRCTDATATAAVWEVVPATDATKLPLAGGTMDENAVVNLFNGSKWQQSTPDKGIAGTAGFSIICSAGYEYKFALGFLFILSDGSSTVRKVLYAPSAPTTADDTTLGYTTDTTWEMADGTLYRCTDVTTAAAVWAVVPTVSATSTTTLTNKRITQRTGTATSSATPTINTDNVDRYDLTAQATAITSFTSNLSGTPTNGQALWISVKGTAARAIAWGASFESGAATLPTTTVTTDRLDVLFVWNAVTSKWRCVLTTASSGSSGGDATKLPLAGGTMDENAIVNLFNGSKWQQSTPDKGIDGDAGFSIICSAGYEYKFANGFLFVLSDNSTTVRKVLYAPSAPTVNEDTTLGYTTDTTWEMADGTKYECTDVTEGAAVWAVVTAGLSDATKLPLAGGTMSGAITNDGVINVNIGNGNTSAGTDAAAVGKNNTASGFKSSAVGYHNTASGYHTSAIGYNNTASGAYSTAVGRGNGALGSGGYDGWGASAFGYQNTASGDNFPTAVGSYNTASADWSSAVGYQNTATGTKSSAFGYQNTATGTKSSAFGYSNTATGHGSYEGLGASAIGHNNTASGDYSSAFGYSNTAVGNYCSSAVGHQNYAAGTFSSAVGSRNTAVSHQSSAFGYHNTASAYRSSAVGYRNTASGDNSSAFGHYNAAYGTGSSAVGSYSLASAPGSSAFGRNNTASGTYSSAVGYSNTASGTDSSAVGWTNSAGPRASAVGYSNTASAYDSTAVGRSNTASATNSTAVGRSNTASVTYSSAVGYSNTASGNRSSAVGYSNTASGNNSSAFGRSNTASGTGSSAVGYQVTTTVANTQEFGYWSNATTRGGAVRVHGTGAVALTLLDTATALTDGGATKGSEADGTLIREGYSIRRDGDEILIDVNVAGTIKTLSLGTAS